MCQVLHLFLSAGEETFVAAEPGVTGLRRSGCPQALVHVAAEQFGNRLIFPGEIFIVLVIQIILPEFSVPEMEEQPGFGIIDGEIEFLCDTGNGNRDRMLQHQRDHKFFLAVHADSRRLVFAEIEEFVAQKRIDRSKPA